MLQEREKKKPVTVPLAITFYSRNTSADLALITILEARLSIIFSCE